MVSGLSFHYLLNSIGENKKLWIFCIKVGKRTEEELARAFGEDRVKFVACNVTRFTGQRCILVRHIFWPNPQNPQKCNLTTESLRLRSFGQRPSVFLGQCTVLSIMQGWALGQHLHLKLILSPSTVLGCGNNLFRWWGRRRGGSWL